MLSGIREFSLKHRGPEAIPAPECWRSSTPQPALLAAVPDAHVREAFVTLVAATAWPGLGRTSPGRTDADTRATRRASCRTRIAKRDAGGGLVTDAIQAATARGTARIARQVDAGTVLTRLTRVAFT